MLNKLPAISTISPDAYRLFQFFGGISLIAIFSAIATEMYFLAGIPAFLLLAYLTIVDFRKIFFLLIFMLPLSIDVDLPGGFATDLPTEPLMVGLMVVYFFYTLKNYKSLDTRFFRHPITVLLFVHLAWTFVTMLTSSLFFVSLKFCLAKLWYVTTFYFMAGLILKKIKDIKQLFWVFVLPLLFTIIWVLAAHSQHNFSFSSSNKVLDPFYINHVIYAATLALFFPFVWYARQWYRTFSAKWWFIIIATIIVFVGIQLSYTRAAILAIFIAFGAYYVIHFKLVKIASALTLVAALGLLIHLVSNNNYFDFAPEYERTITHKNFDNLIEATYSGEDISTMERVYRWVAARYMIEDKPILGFGPGNFYNFYKTYALTSFETYVSDNKEQSGIHNYYLMIWVEQGIIGFFLFLIFSFAVLFKGEHIYHQTNNPERKRIIVIALLSIIIIDALLLINDMIEADKIGSFYFICLAIIVNMDIANRDDLLYVKQDHETDMPK